MSKSVAELSLPTVSHLAAISLRRKRCRLRQRRQEENRSATRMRWIPPTQETTTSSIDTHRHTTTNHTTTDKTGSNPEVRAKSDSTALPFTALPVSCK